VADQPVPVWNGAPRDPRQRLPRAFCIGLPVQTYRWAFVLSGLFTGLAGALYGELARQVTVEQLRWLFSAQLVVMTVLGGTASRLASRWSRLARA
jgi:branched-chain amino acid transport system permease protein